MWEENIGEMGNDEFSWSGLSYNGTGNFLSLKLSVL